LQIGARTQPQTLLMFQGQLTPCGRARRRSSLSRIGGASPR
jgi:hypothetical protein